MHGFAITQIYKSDQAPILLETEEVQHGRGRKKRFHFEALWLSNPDCQEVVKNAWSGGVGEGVALKIEQCASALSGWAAATFGDVKKKIRLKEEELQLWQDKEPDGVMVERCKEIVAELDDLNRLHESYWHTRVRVNELRDGDKNTSYFTIKQAKGRNIMQF